MGDSWNLIEDFGKIFFGWLLGFGSTYVAQKVQGAKTKRSLVAALVSEIEDCQRIVTTYPSTDYRDTTPDFKETRFAIFDTYAFRISDLKTENASAVRDYYYAAKGLCRQVASLPLPSASISRWDGYPWKREFSPGTRKSKGLNDCARPYRRSRDFGANSLL